MKKNGFIATSVLYSFFIVFITLFVALIANFVHNKILLDNVIDDSFKTVKGNKNTKITDFVVGDKVRFANNPIDITVTGPYYPTPQNITQPSDSLLNSTSVWVVADVVTSGANKTYYLLSDMNVGSEFTYRRTFGDFDVEVRTHTISIRIFQDLVEKGYYDHALLFNYTNPTKKFTLSIPTISVLERTSRNSSITNEIKSSIFNTTTNFDVYADKTVGSYTAGKFYNMRYYTVPLNPVSGALSRHCNSTFNASSNALSYGSGNTFGYTNVTFAADKKSKYVNYCLYANPGTYSHATSDKIIHNTETNITDEIKSLTSLGWDLTQNKSYEGGDQTGHDIIPYNVRIMASITVSASDSNIYVSSGKGTVIDPYLITDGKKGRYISP